MPFLEELRLLGFSGWSSSTGVAGAAAAVPAVDVREEVSDVATDPCDVVSNTADAGAHEPVLVAVEVGNGSGADGDDFAAVSAAELVAGGGGAGKTFFALAAAPDTDVARKVRIDEPSTLPPPPPPPPPPLPPTPLLLPSGRRITVTVIPLLLPPTPPEDNDSDDFDGSSLRSAAEADADVLIRVGCSAGHGDAAVVDDVC
jgi:hypothetical protein